MLDQEIYVQPKAAQGEHYIVLHYVQVLILKGPSQFLMYPEKKGLEESWWSWKRDAQVCIWKLPAGGWGIWFSTGCCATTGL